jgi:catechol 2,3-dioxygenase-like lactoylglutathione lyase family enzyme
MADRAGPGAAAPALQAAYPQLFVADFGVSCAFFERKLGFAVVFQYGEPPFYGQVQRGAARLNLRHVDASPFDGDVREREVLLSAYIPVENMRALYVEYQASGAEFQQPLTKQPWGVEEFVVRDPDGNLLCFGSS